MAYVKTTWETGDVITADKLNNMEGGIDDLQPVLLEAEGVLTGKDLIFTFTGHTFADIVEYVQAGRIVRVKCTYAAADILWAFRIDSYEESSLGSGVKIPSEFSDRLSLPDSYAATDTFQLISHSGD